MLEDFLPLVSKPARYINNEVNAVHKDLSKVKTKVCLFFPDTYEVGMSHLGLRILYDILNSRPDTACERVFSPWIDYEEKLRATRRPLRSLESNLPLKQFDIIGITLQYELSYTNILTGLSLGQVPMRSRERTESDPIIIAGGPCAVNPEPLTDFIDVFFIGEAEEAIHEVIELRQQYSDKLRFLEELAKRDGFYVPALGKTTTRRRYIKELDSASYPLRPLLPLMKPIHDRVTVEVARGCIRGCRFCQAGIIYRPFRERSHARIKNILQQSLACTGYEELSLASLSSGDYSAIQPLIIELMDTYKESRTSVSLPSLRVGTLTPEMIKAIAGTRKTGFTLAPEAGTERLRRVINKPVSDQDLMGAAETIFASGWNVLKLYFMIGLPTETDEDLDGIIRLGNELLTVGKRTSKRHVQVNVSVSTFVPKPHTPFQWIGQTPIDEIRKKQAYLQKGLRKRGINLKLHHAETSVLEGAFARGDRSLGRVLEEAVRRGCRFDGWSECFDIRKWTEAFEHCGMDAAACASRTFALDESLPWEHIKTGVSHAFLKQEYQRSEAAEISENCRTECMHCGIACKDGGTPSFGIAAAIPEKTIDQITGKEAKRPVHDPGATTRIRMKYTKTGRIRFLSHLDFMTLIHRTTTRAGVRVAFTNGFNPHPKIAFGPALSVGIESDGEYLDVETDPFIDLISVTEALNQILPVGIRILESRFVPRSSPSLSGSISKYEYTATLPLSWEGDVHDRIKRFLSLTSVPVTKEGRTKDIRSCILAIQAAESTHRPGILITLEDKDPIKPRIQDVIMHCFEMTPEQAAYVEIKRTGLYYDDHGIWKSPMDV